MKKHISVRLEEKDIYKLKRVVKQFGGTGKWITRMINDNVLELLFLNKIIKNRIDKE